MILSAKNITKTYHLEGGDIQILKGINLDIKEGDYLSIIGPSGSGKSTLMHIIGLLDTPTSGSVILEEQDVAKLNEVKLAKLRNKHIGFVFQQYNLLSRTTAVENVELPMVYGGVPAKQRRDRAISLLNMVGLGDRLYHRPNQLSGGQQQRVAIARALAMDPAILLADEPTGNLDSKTGQEILKFFKDLNSQGRTIILVTHDSSVATQAKKIVKIMDGMIVKE